MFVLFVSCFLVQIMDMFSLEDDEEMNNLFITQTPSSNSDKIVKNDQGDEDYNMFFGSS